MDWAKAIRRTLSLGRCELPAVHHHRLSNCRGGCLSCGIVQYAIRAGLSCRRDHCFFDMIHLEDVKYGFARGNEIISDNAAMASPPQSLSAHNCASLCMAELPQQRNAMLEWLGHGVIGIIIKALIASEGVHFRRNAATFPSQPAQRGYTLISNLMTR
jgi:hypothetical protein